MGNVKSCRVTITDVDGIEHSVLVSASTLFEAVALGLRSLRRCEWASEIPVGLNAVKVLVQDVAIEHVVQISNFNNWVARDGGAPAEKAARVKVREILRGR